MQKGDNVIHCGLKRNRTAYMLEQAGFCQSIIFLTIGGRSALCQCNFSTGEVGAVCFLYFQLSNMTNNIKHLHVFVVSLVMSLVVSLDRCLVVSLVMFLIVSLVMSPKHFIYTLRLLLSSLVIELK